MSRTLISPASVHPAPGFSHVAIDEKRGIAYISGQLGLNTDFSLTARDLAGQTRKAMENIGEILNEIGADWGDVMRRTIYTTQPTEFGVITEAIESVQGSDVHPAQTIVGITALAIEGCVIEIEVTVGLK